MASSFDKSKVQILIADDEQSIREMIGATLREDGWSVELAENGRKALELVGKKPFHIVMSDIQMPEMNGMELLEAVKKANPHIEFVVMTSNATLSTAMQAIKFGAYDYLTKPFDDLGVVTKKMLQVAEKILLRQQNAELLRRLKKAGQDVKLLFELASELNGILDEESLERSATTFPARLFQDKSVRAAWLNKTSEGWKVTQRYPDSSAFPFPEERVDSLDEIAKNYSDYRSVRVFPIVRNDKVERALLMEVLVVNLAEVFAEEIQTCYQKVSLHQNIVSLANRDGLTRLYNHRYFQDRLRQEMSQVKRQHAKLSIILLDVDHFKKFNDTHGHPTGDRLLIQLSVLLDQEGERRTSDVVARYGGEEFVLLLPFTPYEGAMTKAERIRSSVEAFHFTDNNGQPLGKVTVSIGVATFPDDAENAAQLVEVADKALYQAKAMGRNRVESFGKMSVAASNDNSKQKATLATVLEETHSEEPQNPSEPASLLGDVMVEVAPEELGASIESDKTGKIEVPESLAAAAATPAPTVPSDAPSRPEEPSNKTEEIKVTPQAEGTPQAEEKPVETPAPQPEPKPTLKSLGNNAPKVDLDISGLMQDINESFQEEAKKKSGAQGNS